MILGTAHGMVPAARRTCAQFNGVSVMRMVATGRWAFAAGLASEAPMHDKQDELGVGKPCASMARDGIEQE